MQKKLKPTATPLRRHESRPALDYIGSRQGRRCGTPQQAGLPIASGEGGAYSGNIAVPACR